MNLTRITGRAEFDRKHVLDSILPFLAVDELRSLPGSLTAADLGSGAGFPGFILARFHPGWRLVLIERTQKKARFLEETARRLGLDNVSVAAVDAREARAHEPALKEGCELVVARAVGRVEAVSKAAAPLLRMDGLLVHYKGGSPDAGELEEGRLAAGKLGLGQADPVTYELPPDAERSVVLSRRRSSGRKRSVAFRRT
jgi:16S rRNA (guanine527-N7)-methyltransferase